VLASKGEIYGEEIVHANENLPNIVVTFPECLCLEATWEGIRSQLKAISKTSNLDIFKRLNKLRKVFIFKHMSESRGLEVCNLMGKEKFQQGEYLFHENSIGNKFYLITKGSVQVIRNGKVVRELEEGSSFGELALLNEEKRTASILALDKVQCFTLTKEKFLDIIDENIMEYLKKKICLEDADVKLSNLYYLSYLGKGKFGSVHLVHNSNFLYAIKCIPKKLAEKQKSLCKYLLSEKRILLGIDHPFIIKIVKTLKQDNFLCYLLEFINGVNMEDYLQSRKFKKNVNEVKFYGATLLVILDYLSSKSIAHRDIKPTNLMIDSNGYIKLIDFGTAKKITDFTHTVIGTPHFIAPEVLMGKGYAMTCDFWSVGVCMYYIFYGSFPFGGSSSDVMEIYKEILHK
jgi:cGMP-dependent protein kinase